MYCSFFGLSQKPFDLTPDPKFIYLTPSHREALASLIYGIHERRGFMAMVGDVGTGKTTLLNTVVAELDKRIDIRVGFIFNPSVTFHGMLTMALVDLGLAKPKEHLSKAKALHRLNEFGIRQLSRGGNVVLLVDEAQNLDRSAMENLRLLSNLETYRNKLIQVVLSGQPELDAKLNRPELLQLNQRISLKRYITALSEAETYEYIQHRLRVAEYSGPALFDLQTQQMIWEYSGGVPRKINILCDNALLVGFALQKKTVDRTVIEEAIKDLTWSPFSEPSDTPATIATETYAVTPFAITPTSPIEITRQLREWISRFRFARTAGLALAAGVIFLAGLFLGSSRSIQRVGKPIPVSAKNQTDVSSHQGSSQSNTVVEPFLVFQERGDALASTETGKPRFNEMNASPRKENRVVVAKRGENLSQIIIQAYGRYNTAVLDAVLQENPEIGNPDRITVGQMIKLPEVK